MRSDIYCETVEDEDGGFCKVRAEIGPGNARWVFVERDPYDNSVMLAPGEAKGVYRALGRCLKALSLGDDPSSAPTDQKGATMMARLERMKKALAAAGGDVHNPLVEIVAVELDDLEARTGSFNEPVEPNERWQADAEVDEDGERAG